MKIVSGLVFEGDIAEHIPVDSISLTGREVVIGNRKLRFAVNRCYPAMIARSVLDDIADLHPCCYKCCTAVNELVGSSTGGGPRIPSPAKAKVSRPVKVTNVTGRSGRHGSTYRSSASLKNVPVELNYSSGTADTSEAINKSIIENIILPIVCIDRFEPDVAGSKKVINHVVANTKTAVGSSTACRSSYAYT